MERLLLYHKKPGDQTSVQSSRVVLLQHQSGISHRRRETARHCRTIPALLGDMDSSVLLGEKEPLERVLSLVLEHGFEISTGHDRRESLTWI